MEGKKLYVGNLNYSTTFEELEDLFSEYGEVKQINIIEGKGFAFVEMSKQIEAEKAKDGLDGYDFKGRMLRVNEARPQRRQQRRSFRRF